MPATSVSQKSTRRWTRNAIEGPPSLRCTVQPCGGKEEAIKPRGESSSLGGKCTEAVFLIPRAPPPRLEDSPRGLESMVNERNQEATHDQRRAASGSMSGRSLSALQVSV